MLWHLLSHSILPCRHTPSLLSPFLVPLSLPGPLDLLPTILSVVGSSQKSDAHTYRVMYATHPLPQRTTSPVARRLHAMLRHCPGYSEACERSSRRVASGISATFQHSHR